MSLEFAIGGFILFAVIGFFIGRRVWPGGINIRTFLGSVLFLFAFLLILNIFIFQFTPTFLVPTSTSGFVFLGVIFALGLLLAFNRQITTAISASIQAHPWRALSVIGAIIILLFIFLFWRYRIFV